MGTGPSKEEGTILSRTQSQTSVGVSSSPSNSAPQTPKKELSKNVEIIESDLMKDISILCDQEKLAESGFTLLRNNLEKSNLFGRVIFHLDEIPVNIEYKTQRGNTVRKINNSSLLIGGEKFIGCLIKNVNSPNQSGKTLNKDVEYNSQVEYEIKHFQIRRQESSNFEQPNKKNELNSLEKSTANKELEELNEKFKLQKESLLNEIEEFKKQSELQKEEVTKQIELNKVIEERWKLEKENFSKEIKELKNVYEEKLKLQKEENKNREGLEIQLKLEREELFKKNEEQWKLEKEALLKELEKQIKLNKINEEKWKLDSESLLKEIEDLKENIRVYLQIQRDQFNKQTEISKKSEEKLKLEKERFLKEIEKLKNEYEEIIIFTDNELEISKQSEEKFELEKESLLNEIEEFKKQSELQKEEVTKQIELNKVIEERWKLEKENFSKEIKELKNVYEEKLKLQKEENKNREGLEIQLKLEREELFKKNEEQWKLEKEELFKKNEEQWKLEKEALLKELEKQIEINKHEEEKWKLEKEELQKELEEITKQLDIKTQSEEKLNSETKKLTEEKIALKNLLEKWYVIVQEKFTNLENLSTNKFIILIARMEKLKEKLNKQSFVPLFPSSPKLSITGRSRSLLTEDASSKFGLQLHSLQTSLRAKQSLLASKELEIQTLQDELSKQKNLFEISRKLIIEEIEEKEREEELKQRAEKEKQEQEAEEGEIPSQEKRNTANLNLKKKAEEKSFSIDDLTKYIQQQSNTETLPTLSLENEEKVITFKEELLQEKGAERAIRYEFVPFSDQWGDGKWEKSGIVIKIQKEKFEEGGLRNVYNMIDLHDKAIAYIVKVSKTSSHNTRECYENDVKMQALCSLWAERYNQEKPPKQIEYLKAYLIELIDRPNKSIMLLERKLEGEFIKYSDNKGSVSTKRNTPQTFSHFTYEKSKNYLVIVDIQGVGDCYTDPQIHTKDREGFGVGNSGKQGIEQFISTHNCNALCKALNLTSFHQNDNQSICKKVSGTLPFPKKLVESLPETELEEFPESKEEPKLECIRVIKSRSRIGSLCFLTQGFIATGLVDGSITVYDTLNFEQIHTIKKHIGTVEELVFNGEFLFSGGEDSDLRIWIWKEKRLVSEKELKGHKQAIRTLQCTKTRIYSAGSDKTIRIWNISDFSCIEVIEAHEKHIQTLALSEDEKFFFSSGNDGVIKIWDSETFECLANLDDRAGWIRSLSICGRYLFSGGNDRQIVIWDLKKLQKKSVIEVVGKIKQIVAAKNFLACAEDDIKIYNYRNNFNTIATLKDHKMPLDILKVFGQMMISSTSSEMRIWKF